MNLTNITITVGVKRCTNFQSADATVTVEFTPTPGEDRKESIQKAHDWLFAIVAPLADEDIRKVVHLSSMDY